uniref:Uncharacterized protein n=1 Tax=Anguilla anguilla TaxID=7936 RepID=A0A0E9SFL6_ANGAN
MQKVIFLETISHYMIIYH